MDSPQSSLYDAHVARILDFYEDAAPNLIRGLSHSEQELMPDKSLMLFYLMLRWLNVNGKSSVPIELKKDAENFVNNARELVKYYHSTLAEVVFVSVQKDHLEMDDVFFLYALKNKFAIPMYLQSTPDMANYLERDIIKKRKYEELFDMHKERHTQPTIARKKFWIYWH